MQLVDSEQGPLAKLARALAKEYGANGFETARAELIANLRVDGNDAEHEALAVQVLAAEYAKVFR